MTFSFARLFIHTAANEEPIYAAAILEPGPKEAWSEKSIHFQDEICPVPPDLTSTRSMILRLSQYTMQIHLQPPIRASPAER